MTDRDDELVHLRRTVRSLAEATRDAVLSGLGVGAPGGAGEGEGGHG